MALTLRVEALEAAALARLAAGRDDLAAQRVAAALGFAPEVLVLPKPAARRRELARELRQRGWSAARLAKVFRVCERTAERWVSRQGPG